jgi:arginyl-tRNA synthetase
MSSRTGNVFTAVKLLDELEKSIDKTYPESEVKNDVFLAALKYTFLRQKIGNDIIFNTEESVSLEGNSGPYIQYAHARARSILAKAPNQKEEVLSDLSIHKISLDDKERRLALKISQFTDVVENSIDDLMPHLICTYLYELAQEFNSFYENSRVIGDPRMFTRLGLVKSYAEVLKMGLNLLKIPAPMHM